VIKRTACTLALLAVVLLAPVVRVDPAYADAVRNAQWPLRFLEVDHAHRLSRGAGVVVGIVDTGVDAAHADVAGSVLPGADIVLGTGPGWRDPDGHGTEMAGLIVGHGTGGGGVLGMAPAAKALPVAAYTDRSLGVGPLGPKAIRWAVDHGARVLCLAFAGVVGNDDLASAIRYASAHDVVLVAGAGNRPRLSGVGYPAAYQGVVAAVGVDRDGRHAEVSVTGPEAVLAAPAVDVVTTAKGGGYVKGTGTSAATAIIAGVAALVRARFPELSAAEVVHRLTATARDVGPPGRDELYGYGIVNPVGALASDVPPLSPSPTPSGTDPPSPPPAAAGRTGPGSPVIGLVTVIGVVLAVGGWLVLRRRRIG
jgi:type VII secretion-associated serine protease mycosin